MDTALAAITYVALLFVPPALYARVRLREASQDGSAITASRALGVYVIILMVWSIIFALFTCMMVMIGVYEP